MPDLTAESVLAEIPPRDRLDVARILLIQFLRNCETWQDFRAALKEAAEWSEE